MLRVRFYLLIFGIAIFLFLIYYAIALSPIFQVREFYIAGTSRLSDEMVMDSLRSAVLKNRMEIFLGINNLLVWDKDIDVSKTPLSKAVIGRDWIKQSVRIEARERIQFAIWCRFNSCYWMDNEGILFEEAPRTEGSLVLTVYDDEKRGIIIGETAIEERYAANLIKILQGVMDMKVPAQKTIFSRKLQEVQISTYSGPDFLFSARFDPEINLTALRSLEEKTRIDNMRYVDLRVENRLYYQ